MLRTTEPRLAPRTPSSLASRLWLTCTAATLIAALLCAGCGGSRSPAEDAAQQAAAANQRLSGSWVLVEFQPDVPLEPMLAQLLAAQVGRLTVQFDGTRMVATGVGVQATRSYAVDSAGADQLHLTLVDETGVRYETNATFAGDTVRFQALTMPWAGHGVLKRAPASY